MFVSYIIDMRMVHIKNHDNKEYELKDSGQVKVI